MDNQAGMKVGAAIFFLSLLIGFVITDVYRGLPFIIPALYWYLELWKNSKFLAIGVFMGVAIGLSVPFKVIFQPLSRNLAIRNVKSRAAIPLSIKDLSAVIPTSENELTPNIRDGIGGYKWYSFTYANTPKTLHVEFLADSEKAPIQQIRVELEWTNAWYEKLLPISVEQVVTMVNAITEITPDGLQKLRKWLSKRPREDKKLKTKIITLKIFSPIEGMQKVLIICNSQKRSKSGNP